MEAFIITLREGLEAALVVGLILAYLNRTGRTDLRRWAYLGLGLVAGASVLAAVLFSLAGFDPENEILEGALLAVAAALVVSLVVWMWRTAASLKRRIEDRLESLTAAGAKRRGWGVLAFVFFMVFREGVEMVLFLAALSLTAVPDLAGIFGGISGLGLAALFGFLVVKGSVRVNLRRFFGVTGLVLLVLAARLIAGSLHEFFEVKLLPSSPALLAVIGFIVRDDTSIVILIALVVLPVLALLPELRLKPRERQARPGESDPDRRRRLAELYRARRWQFALVGVMAAAVLPLGAAAYAAALGGFRPEPLAVSPGKDGVVRIGAAELEAGRLNLYSYRGNGAEVRFLVIKRDGNDVAVALNVCAICPPIGYHQDGETLVCDNCNAPINLETVGLEGGCNPVPLAASLVGGEVRIALSDLEKAQAFFTR